jgi:protein MpaA
MRRSRKFRVLAVLGALLIVAIVAGLVVLRATGHREPFPETQPVVRDISLVEDRITDAVAISEQLTLTTIGEVVYGEYRAPVWAVSFTPSEEPKHKVLLTGGVHGDEPAGVEIMVQMIDTLAENPQKYENVYFDIVPIVNPWGWSHDIRFDRDGRDVNRDFASFTSQEAVIITEFTAGKKYDLIVDHHECVDGTGFFMYQLANPSQSISRKVIKAVRDQGYPIEQDVRMIILKTEDGLIDAPMWTLWFVRLANRLSMTNYFRLNNNDMVYLIETPTSLSWDSRLTMHKIALDTFLNSLSSDFAQGGC